MVRTQHLHPYQLPTHNSFNTSLYLDSGLHAQRNRQYILAPYSGGHGIICSFNGYFAERYPEATWANELVFYIYLTTSFVCFGMSAAYHTLQCHSERYASLWVCSDYVGIVGQIVGSCVPGVYLGFYCEPDLQKLYWTMVSTTRWMWCND
jgi:predicted membrane channel-forming protein YqfA (hemolysin III family)